jgi:hypothetical protein
MEEGRILYENDLSSVLNEKINNITINIHLGKGHLFSKSLIKPEQSMKGQYINKMPEVSRLLQAASPPVSTNGKNFYSKQHYS